MAIDLKAHLQAQADVAAEALGQYDVDMEKSKAEGVEIGRTQIQLPDAANPDAQYVQAQMNEAVSTAVDNANAASKAQIEELTASVKSAADESKAALASLKKDIAGKIRNANVDDLSIADELEKTEDAGTEPVKEEA